MRSAADVIEDAEFLDSSGVGAIDAAARLDFSTTRALEKWLKRHDRYDLWLRFKARDPEGIHWQRRIGMSAVPSGDPLAAIIQRGKDHSKARMRAKANRIETLLNELGAALTEDAAAERERVKARADVERLEQQLAEAKARLRGDKTPVRKASAVLGEAKEIRAWAAANDVECPAMGRIPAHVREQYEADTSEQAAS